MRQKARRLTASLLNSSEEFRRKAHIIPEDGLLSKTSKIYKHLLWQRPQLAEDFLSSARSLNRRNEIRPALSTLEAGLNEFPGSESLLQTYLRICCEQGQLLRFIDFINPTKKEICKTLACLDIQDPISDRKPTHRFRIQSAVYLTQDIIAKNFGDDVVKYWRLADLLDHAGKLHITKKLHQKISRRPPVEPDDYLYGGVSEMRLGNVESGFSKLELGLAAYPESESLKSVLKDCCHAQLAFDRYLKLYKMGDGEAKADTTLALDFYSEAFKHHPPEAFIVKFKEAELNCSAADVIVLHETFLAQLHEKNVSIEAAKLCLFLSRLLGLTPAFSERMFQAFYSIDWGSDDKAVKYLLMLTQKLTLPLMPNHGFDPKEVINQFIVDARSLAVEASPLHEPISDFTKHYWAVWQSFLCLAEPQLYTEAMTAFERLAFKLWPGLDYTAPHIRQPCPPQAQRSKKIRVGFMVLDVMPMMSGLAERLDRDVFETVFLHAGKCGDSQTTHDWIARADATVEYSGSDAYSAIDTIAKTELDILISGPCVPQMFLPLMARLAHLQMVLLEPNWPDGVKNSDYYISWGLAEPKNYKEVYKTPVSLLHTPPYWIERPTADEISAISDETGDGIRRRLLNLGPSDRVYICANTPPKIHPAMDDMFCKLLERDPSGYLIFTRSEHSPAQILKARLREKLGSYFDRVIFINTLAKAEAHALLLSADCCIDSYPICGMSSSFDGIRLGAPIVTLPTDIPFGRWTAAIYEYLGVSGLTAKDTDEYVDIAIRLATDKEWRLQKSAEMREKSSLYVESKASFDEFQHFLIQAWRRKQSGLPPTSWVAGGWQ